jgi:DNA polymerase
MAKGNNMIYIDTETRSPVDIRKAGADVYTRHPETQLLCVSFAIDDGPIKTFIPPSEIERASGPLGDLPDIESHPLPDFTGQELVAWNATFDWLVFNHVMGLKIPLEQMRDPMAQASQMALPGGLGPCGVALGITTPKQDSKVMRTMSRPPYKTDAGLLSQLVEYCERDVEAMREIDKTLLPLPPEERAIWLANERTNQRGLLIDHDLIDYIMHLNSEEDKVLSDMAENLGLSSALLRSQKQTLEWCESQGVGLPDLSAGTLALAKIENPEVIKALEIREQICKSSLKKYEAMREMTCPDGRIRGNHVYHRATTGRFAGAGVQVQNIPRPEIKDTDKAAEYLLKNEELPELGLPVKTALASLVRSCIKAPDGFEFICADFAGIESRVLLWEAKDRAGLDSIRAGEDLYCVMASKIFGHEVNKNDHPEKRQVGKAAILGLGYGCGAKKFGEMCELSGSDLLGVSPKQVVDAYREQFKAVVDLWGMCDRSAQKALGNPSMVVADSMFRWKYSKERRLLVCQLPSGRWLFYQDPRMVEGNYGPQMQILTAKQGNRWGRTHVWGGVLAQNATQAIARDLLAHALVVLDREGWNPVLHVHDEIMCEEKVGEKSLDELMRIMCDLPEWAKGLPVEAEGFVSRRFRK